MLSLYFSVLGLFLICLGVQMLLWRTLRRNDVVRGQILWLFLLFLGGPLLQFCLAPSLSQLILGLGLGCTYIMSFPAAAAKSPSLLILDILDRHGALTKPELEVFLAKDVSLVGDRLQDLRADGLVKAGEKDFRPSFAGRLLGHIFWSYRRILGLPLGEG